MIQLVIADDHKLFRQTLGELLAAQPGIEIVALCQDSTEAIDTVRAENPDLLLMDMKISPLSGIAATAAIMAFSTTRIVGLSMYSSTTYAKRMLKAGAKGYITKNASVNEMIEGIHRVMQGEKYLCQEIKDMMANEALQTDGGKPVAEMLTPRELEVVKFISVGLSSRQIASRLGVTFKTIEAHRHNMLQKLQLKNSNELINFVTSNEQIFL